MSQKIKSRAELMRRLQVGVKLKIARARPDIQHLIGQTHEIVKVQINDIVFAAPDGGAQRVWQAIPPASALRFTDTGGFDIYEYARKDERYIAVEGGALGIGFEFLEDE